MNEISNKLGNEAREVYQDIFNHLSNGTYRVWYGQGQKSGSIFFLYEGVNRNSHNLFFVCGLMVHLSFNFSI